MRFMGPDDLLLYELDRLPKFMAEFGKHRIGILSILEEIGCPFVDRLDNHVLLAFAGKEDGRGVPVLQPGKFSGT
jgi:hypothetical protein